MDENSQATPPLYWEHSYEIVLALIDAHPDVDVESIGMEQLLRWIIALPNFADDPHMVTKAILNDILREWYEEISPL